MSIYRESNITINLTNYPHLRLKDCRLYKEELSQSFFKEVDFIWWNPNEKCLYLSDFKDFSTVQSTNKISKVIPNLVDKSIHVLNILTSIWLETKGSQELTHFFKQYLPEQTVKKTSIKIVHIINCDSIFDMHFAAINSEFMSRFGAFSILFDIETSIVLPIGRAKKLLDVFE
jgi:hypothetical protein